MKVIAQIISWIFIPLIMPIYALMVVMYVPSFESSFFQYNTLYWMHPNFKLLVLSMFAIFCFLAPGISLIMLRRSKAISSIEMDDRQERNIPIIISALYCLVLGVLLWVKTPNQMIPVAIYALPWGGFLGISIAGIINRFDKISLHALGAGMMFGFFISYYYYQAEYYFEILIFATLVCGLVMSARLYLKKHTMKQVISGFLLGFVSLFGILQLFIFFSS
ncbi:MAG: phosphatase PAP2 family protein [Bacteroidetes bacterium]|nr:MAG: phosphatase PAP2 family protein [Bacteroidota bacterium]